jgi:hypothetical protein
VALREDGRILVMGSFPGMPPSEDGGPLTVPTLLSEVADIIQVGAGLNHFLALRSDGRVFAWGDNASGQLGTGDTLIYHSGQQPYGLSGVTRIWAAVNTNIVSRGDGSFWGWGGNESGQLCDGSAYFENAPNLAYGTSGVVFNAGTGFADWLTTYFNEQELRDVELFADVKDPDDDGLVNLIEYALGTNPRKHTIPVVNPDAPLPPPTPDQEYTRYVPTVRLEKVRRNYYSRGVGIAGEGEPDEETTHLVMTVPRAERRSDVDYIVEVSDDLEHWHFGTGYTVDVLNTLTNLVVYDSRPAEENSKRYIRLRLVRNNPGQTSIPR